MIEEMLTVAETARTLKVSKATVYRLCGRGLPNIKKSFGLRFRREDLEKWISQDKRRHALSEKLIKNALTSCLVAIVVCLIFPRLNLRSTST